MGGRAVRAVATVAITLALWLAVAAVATAQAPSLGEAFERVSRSDFGGVRNVLPGGQGETVNAFEFAEYQLTRKPPQTFVTQVPLYTGIYFDVRGLADADVERFFKPATFGVPPADVASVTRPRPGVTIVRDGDHHVPTVYGNTRSDTMFGAGYATAVDRLFFMDVLRHTGRARLTELIGPGESNETLEMDANQLQIADYTEAELQEMIDELPERFGQDGAQAVQDLRDYTAGVNAYIAEARLDPRKLPVEYAVLAEALEDWKETDSVAVASLVGAIFGRGGGSEARNAEALQVSRQRFGMADGYQVFTDFRRENDDGAPVTTRKPFLFDEPSRLEDDGIALIDPGSMRPAPPKAELPPGDPPIGPGGSASATSLAERLRRALSALRIPGHQSNALLVGRRHSSSGHPLAVMGPQVAYWSPQILLELDLHGPGIDARGAAFPGISFYVLLGRGKDFAWSATSSTSDNVDEFVEELCEPDGSEPTLGSRHYLYRGECVPFKVHERTLTTKPSPASPSTPLRRYELEVLRSVHGPVQAFATSAGRPVAISEARSTYMHELASAVAFQDLNENVVHDARTFQRTMSRISFVFNWFYVDDRDISLFSSGSIPRRSVQADSTFPAWGTGEYDWQGFDPATYTFEELPFEEHPRDTNPSHGYFVNWNNKPAPDFRAADDNFAWGSVHRVERLGDRLRTALRRGRGRVSLTDAVRVMEEAATVDLRGQELYPLLRTVIGRTGDADLRQALQVLDAWYAGGSHRRDLDADDVYDDSAAVALMDAWWPPLLEGIFQPVLGDELFARFRRMNPYDPPGSQGSAFISGWYSYVDKDLRRVLGGRPREPLSRVYCGRGSRRGCRDVLLASLAEAIATVRREHGSLTAVEVPATCPVESPPACDQIVFTPAGAVSIPPIRWQDRPTFQQVVELRRHRPR